MEEIHVIHESEILYGSTERTKRILEAKNEPVTLQEITNGCDHVISDEKQELLIVLEKFNDLFDGSLGTWKGEKLSIEVKEEARPYYARAFPIPKSREEGLKKEINWLCEFESIKESIILNGLHQPSLFPRKMGLLDSFLILGNSMKKLSKNLFLFPRFRIGC